MRTIAHQFIEGLEDRDRKFYQAVLGEDDLGVVVRAHIHIEHELREFVKAKAPAPGKYRGKDFNYGRTVTLALILGLNPELEAPLNFIGGLRNKFAHNLETRLVEKNTKDFESALGPTLRRLMLSTYEKMRADHEGWPDNIGGLSDRDRMVFLIVSMRSALVGEHFAHLNPRGIDLD